MRIDFNNQKTNFKAFMHEDSFLELGEIAKRAVAQYERMDGQRPNPISKPNNIIFGSSSIKFSKKEILGGELKHLTIKTFRAGKTLTARFQNMFMGGTEGLVENDVTPESLQRIIDILV